MVKVAANMLVFSPPKIAMWSSPDARVEQLRGQKVNKTAKLSFSGETYRSATGSKSLQVSNSRALPFVQRSRTDNIYAPSITDVLFATRNQPEVIEPEPCHLQGGDGLSQSVSVCLGLHHSVSLCLGRAVCVFVRLRLSVCVFVCLCQSWSVSVGLCPVSFCLCLSPVCRSVRLSVVLSVVCLSFCLSGARCASSVCLSVSVSVGLSISLGLSGSVWVCLGLSGSVSHVRVVHVVHVCVPSTTPLTPRPPSLFTSPHTSHPSPQNAAGAMDGHG